VAVAAGLVGFDQTLDARRKKEPTPRQAVLAPNVFPTLRKSSSSHCLMPPLLAQHVPRFSDGMSHGYMTFSGGRRLHPLVILF
jgi:hypothetical protein